MSFYPDVQPGDDLDYSAQRENDLRHLLNSGNGFGDGVNRGKTHKVRVPVWNITPNNINSGSLVYVVVSGNSMCGEAFPVAPVTDYSDFDFDSAPFGILENSLKPKATGDLVLSGTVSVSISGGTEGNFAKPTSDGTFERGQEGFRILHLNGSSAIILVGDYRYNFTPGVGINKAELSGGTISTALVQGSNVTLTPDPDTGAITISATGSTSGGGGLEIPPYSSLSFGGGAPEYGLGHTFLLAVKAGDVGFYDDGGGAVGKWTNKSGTSSQTLTAGTSYHATEDGWLRISVVDNGSAPGRCMGFSSSTGGFPLYKYGTFGSTVSGICYPDYKELGTVTGSPSSDVRGTGTTYLLPVWAGITVKWYSSGNNVFARYAPGVGVSVTGATAANIAKDTDFPVLANGWVRISVIDEGTIENSCLRFYVNNNDVTSYLSLYRYNKFQRLRGDNETIQVSGDVISYIGSAGSGIGYPDYIALAGGTASNSLGTITDSDYEEGDSVTGPSTMPQNPKLGITYFLPVPANKPIKYYASAAVLVRFAPVSGSGHYYYDLSNELEWTPNCAGWLRISILDDGQHASDCIRLYVDGEQWSDAVLLYKCGTFQGGATGITSAVSGGTATVSLTGGSGSVKFVGNGSVSITVNANGEVVINGSGSGGGFYPAWSTTGHTDVIPITDGSGQGYTANADGWLFACAFFDPLEDRLKYKTYDAHVVVGNAPMKIAELKLPGGTPFIKVGNTKYTRDADEDWSYDPYAEHPYYSYFAWSANGTTIYTQNVAPDVGEPTYTYDYEDEEFVDTEQEVQETNAATFAVCMGSGSPIPVKAGAVIKYVVTADGRTFYSRRTPPPCFCVFYSSNPPSAE